MRIIKSVRVLVVDDSILFREALIRGLSKDMGIEIIGSAGDAYEARDKIVELMPDVVTLDVEMPKMGGIEFLKRLMPQYPLPVIVISALSDSVFDALNAGAVDFVSKLGPGANRTMDNFIDELIVKIKIAAVAKISENSRGSAAIQSERRIHVKKNNMIIAIGASTGGTQAIFEIVRDFPKDMPGIVITQHMPPVFTNMYAKRLNNSCQMEVKEAETGDLILQGRILVAPGDRHMEVKKRGNNYYVECLNQEKVNGHCPAVDVLFNSIAEKVGSVAIGVILTGMGYDGAKGLMNMKSKGAYTIGQDEKSSVVYGMPKVAFDIGAVKTQASLKDIPNLIYSIMDKATK